MKKIPLGNGGEALVDDGDFEQLSKFRWHKDSDGYPRNGLRRMHALIINAPKGMEVDHRNRNPLDNQRHNLRPATHQQNLANSKRAVNNTTGYKGVNFQKSAQKFRAQIKINGKNIYLGLFESAELAHQAYTSAAIQAFGEYANP